MFVNSENSHDFEKCSGNHKILADSKIVWEFERIFLHIQKQFMIFKNNVPKIKNIHDFVTMLEYSKTDLEFE